MPTDKGLRIWDGTDIGPVEVTDEEGNPIRIKNMPRLTLDQEQDPDPVWETFRMVSTDEVFVRHKEAAQDSAGEKEEEGETCSG